MSTKLFKPIEEKFESIEERLARLEKQRLAPVVETDEPFISAEQLAKKLGVTKSTVYNNLESLPHYKFGAGTVMFKYKEVIEMARRLPKPRLQKAS